MHSGLEQPRIKTATATTQSIKLEEEEDRATAGTTSCLNESYSFDEFIRDQNHSFSQSSNTASFSQRDPEMKVDLDGTNEDYFSCDSSIELLEAELQNLSRDLGAEVCHEDPLPWIPGMDGDSSNGRSKFDAPSSSRSSG